jgi:transcriptional regulator with XRE-family HTH domain
MTVEKVEEVRLRNFLFLFERFKDEIWREWPNEPERGMLTRFADRLGINKIYLSQVKNGRKVIGTVTRNNIESALELPEGWMDTDHTQEALEGDDAAMVARDTFMAMYQQAPEATKDALLRVMGALVTGKPLENLVDDAAHGKEKRKVGSMRHS